MSFSFIPRLLRYSLRLRARSHNFSGELCSALLSPSFRTFVGPVFSNIAPATLLSSISYYNKPQHLSTNHNIYLTVLLSLKFTFTQWGTFLALALGTMYLLVSLSSHFTIIISLARPRPFISIYISIFFESSVQS